MGESDGKLSYHATIEPQMESSHLESNPIVCLTNVRKEIPAAVVNFDKQLRCINTGKENLPVEDVNSFVRLLNSGSDNVKLEAASSLLYVVKMNYTSVVVECGAIPHLIDAVKYGNSSVRNECIKCIGAMVGTSAKVRDHVIQANGLIVLLDILGDSPTSEISRICVGALSQLLCDKSPISLDAVSSTIPRLVKLLDIKDDSDMISRVSHIISDLCFGNTSCIQAVIDAGAKPKLTSLLTHHTEIVVTSTLRALRSLVPPRDSSPSHCTHSARVSSSKRKLDYSKLLSPLKLIHPSTQYPKSLSELKIMTCQNVEFFQATVAEVNNHEIEFEAVRVHFAVGSIRAEQVGLRCIHCGHTPLAKACFSTVFPRSISSIAASLCHMAAVHFTKCTRIPPDIANTFCYFTRVTDQEHANTNKEKITSEKVTSNKAAFDFFCADLCGRIGIEDDSPSESGLIYTRNMHDEQNSLQKKVNYTVDNDSDDTVANASVAFSGRVRQNFQKDPASSLDFRGYYQGGNYNNKGESATPSYSYQQLSVVPDMPDVEDNNVFRIADFVQDPYGTWQCRYCISSPPEEKMPGSSWYDHSAPPAAFIEQHVKLCPFVFGHQTSHQRVDGPSHCGESFPTHNNHYHPLSFHPNSQHVWEQLPEINSHPNGPELSQYHVKLSQPGYAHFDPPPSSHRQGAPLQSKPSYKPRDELYAVVANIKETNTNLTRPEDRVLITQFLFNVINQLQRCRFSESDVKTARGGVRLNIDIGFGGMQCVHCKDKNYPRKFFWSTVDRLANSFSEIVNHIMKCKYIPPEQEVYLKQLKILHQDQMSRLPRGSQKVFFRRMWRRIHSEDHDPFTSVLGRTDTKSEVSCKKSPPSSVHGLDTENVGMNPSEAAKALADMVTNPSSCSKRVLLGIDEDKDWLSENDCHLRKNIEVFCATSESIRAKGRHSKVSIGRIGLRCVHCAKFTNDKALPVSALFFPKTMDKIYACVREFHQKHLKYCPSISKEGKIWVESFNGSMTMSIVLRQYYVDSAQKLGMRDTASGIRVADGNIATPVAKANTSSVECSEGGILSTSTGINNNQVIAVTPFDDGRGMPPESMLELDRYI